MLQSYDKCNLSWTVGVWGQTSPKHPLGVFGSQISREKSCRISNQSIIKVFNTNWKVVYIIICECGWVCVGVCKCVGMCPRVSEFVWVRHSVVAQVCVSKKTDGWNMGQGVKSYFDSANRKFLELFWQNFKFHHPPHVITSTLKTPPHILFSSSYFGYLARNWALWLSHHWSVPKSYK